MSSANVNFTAVGPRSQYWFNYCKLISLPHVIFPRKRVNNPTDEAFETYQQFIAPITNDDGLLSLASDKSSMDLPFSMFHIAKKFLPRKLNVPFNDINSIPESEELEYVDQLDLSYNKLDRNIVNEIRQAKNVYELSLSGNNIKRILINVFHGFQNLEVLGLSECGLNDIENVNWVNVKALKSIVLKNKNISSINRLIKSCPNLRYIYAHSNRINSLPMITSNANQYSVLAIQLFENVFTTFPVEVRSYTNLKLLVLNYNRIDTNGITTFLDLTEEPHNNNLGPMGIYVMYNCIEFIPLHNTEQVAKLNRVLNIVSDLWLVGNPLHCSCQEFRDWLKLKGVNMWMAKSTVQRKSMWHIIPDRC